MLGRVGLLLGCALAAASLLAQTNLSAWLGNAVAGSAIEAALYRAMPLPGGIFLFRRPPGEAQAALTHMAGAAASDPALWQLRALEDEHALDFDAAERDWKTWTEKAPDPGAAELDLAGFYARRLRPQPELEALAAVGRSPARAAERWTAPERQRAWQAWSQSLEVVRQFHLPRSAAASVYQAWEQRYPQAPGVYAQEFAYRLAGGEDRAGEDVLARYRRAFPRDAATALRWQAQLAARRGSPRDGLALYDRNFQPLWPQPLITAWFQLLTQAGEVRRTGDELRAKLATDPRDLLDTARLFWIEQQQGQTEAARAVLVNYRTRREAAGGAWSGTELDTLAQLADRAGDIPEAARYYYALATPPAGTPDPAEPDAEEKGLAGLARLLLSAPDQPLRAGAANLSMYRDIATLDRGPGYLNGILSLLLNSDSPRRELAQEERLATPYYHRAKAAELIARVDQRYPQAKDRPELHASLIVAYQDYGDDADVVREAKAFLANYPEAPQRVEVALEAANADARMGQTDQEFGLYRDLLQELAARAGGMPLSGGGAAGAQFPDSEAAPGPPLYAQVLDQYLSRLVALGRIPDALAVLRGELDRNPRDPGLYERLAQFLQQNALDGQIEAVYQRALQQFPDATWYAKLARFYLRRNRRADYAALTRKVTGIFSGTGLEQYLEQAPAPDRSLALEVSLYANRRFPHDLRFVEDLIADYTGEHRDDAAMQLLWAHWSESPDLRRQLFEKLSSRGRLDPVLATLRQQSPQIGRGEWKALAQANPAAERFWVEACLWQSHYEQAVDAAGALSSAFPAETEIGDDAAALYRSFAYYQGEDTAKAVGVENRLLSVHPGDVQTLAHIGDIYADRGGMSEAAPYWRRMGEVHPGDSDGYLQSATVYWDYFEFPQALGEIERARQALRQPTLYGYEAGAIDESSGDTAAAIHEYAASALRDGETSPSRGRLLTLAKRAPLQPLIEAATSRWLQGAAPTPVEISLRAGILDAEHRRDQLTRELVAAAGRTASFESLDAIRAAAQRQSLPEAVQASLERQIALTTDPVRSLQLRYQLVDFYVSRHDAAAAAASVDAVDRDHPRILGVVRFTVDYDWNHRRRPRAVTVLLGAARTAYPALRRDFLLEAAAKLTDMGEYARSRSLLEALLAANPEARVETALAANYGRSGDERGLMTFYQQRLRAAENSTLTGAAKRDRIAEVRRGMIAAAKALGQPEVALDQYVELINAYPDDDGLTQEAALFALGSGQGDRLLGVYAKAEQASPRDPHPSIVLARLATTAENLPTAIDAYGKAIALRPERQDLLAARAGLEERLQRFDGAATDYQRLYALSYHDPQWMQKLAEDRARQGRTADAAQALQTAWIDGRAPKAANDFQVAAELDSWNMVDLARQYVQQGVRLAGSDLLVDSADQSGAATYGRILARQRQADTAVATLLAARSAAGAGGENTAPAPANGNASNQPWLELRRRERAGEAQAGFAGALRAVGGAVKAYYTPEESARFAAWLQTRSRGARANDLREIWLPLAASAGMAESEANLRWQLAALTAPAETPAQLDGWARLEERRGQLNGVEARLAGLAGKGGSQAYTAALWRQAAEVARRSGDTGAELGALQALDGEHMLGNDQARYFQLLLTQRPQELVRHAAQDPAARFLVMYGSDTQAFAAIAARAANQPPAWLRAYTALTGLYRDTPTPQVTQAFVEALDAGAAIGDRMEHPVDRDQQLAGSVWFYYGSRYGEYLDRRKNPQAGQYLVSGLEAAPGSPAAYIALAGYETQAGRYPAALTEYRHALEIAPDQPEALNSMAVVETKSGDTAAAVATWKSAVSLLAKQADAHTVPSSFWSGTIQVLRDASAAGQLRAISPPIDAMLRHYLARNGNYRAEALLEAGYRAHGDSMTWALQTVAGLDAEAALLRGMHNSLGSLGNGQASLLLGRLVEIDRRTAQRSGGPGYSNLASDQAAWAAALLDEGETKAARRVLAQVPAAQRWTPLWLPAELRLAQSDHALPKLVAEWRAAGPEAPPPGSLLELAANLAEPGQDTVLTYAYERMLAMRDFAAPNFLGLAAVRLNAGDVAGAMQLLRRMLLISGDVYSDLDSAAALLEERHHPAEALQFLRPLAEFTPWNAEYKVRLAAALLAVQPSPSGAPALLQAVAADPSAEYRQRTAAAEALKGRAQTGVLQGELALLAQTSCPTPEQASQPMVVAARVAAASCAAGDAVREPLLRAAVALRPDDTRIRLQYVWAAFGSGKAREALLAAEPLLAASPFGDRSAYGYTGEGNGVAAMDPADAGRLYLLVAQALDKMAEDAIALREADAGIRLAGDSASAPALRSEESRLKDRVARQQQNAARAPQIGDAIEQQRVVRPRLTASEAPR